MKDISIILHRCSRGSREAQMELYDHYIKSIYNTAYRITGNTQDAQDVAQESFIKFFQRIDQYVTHAATVEYLLKRIAINGSIDVVRRRRISFIELNEHITPCQESPESDDQEYLLDQIKTGIANLPPTARIILTLRLIEGLEYDEIAQELSITPSSARSQYSRARQQLLNRLKSS